MHASRSLRDARGLTLVELITVMVIGTGLALLGAPSYFEWIANIRARAQTEALADALRRTQQAAVARNTRVELVFTDDAPTRPDVTASATGRNWVLRVAAPQTLIEGRSGVDGTTGVTINAARAVIGFNGLGRLLDTNDVTVDIAPPARGTRPLRVAVALGGGVRVCDPGVQSTDVRAC